MGGGKSLQAVWANIHIYYLSLFETLRKMEMMMKKIQSSFYLGMPEQEQWQTLGTRDRFLALAWGIIA